MDKIKGDLSRNWLAIEFCVCAVCILYSTGAVHVCIHLCVMCVVLPESLVYRIPHAPAQRLLTSSQSCLQYCVFSLFSLETKHRSICAFRLLPLMCLHEGLVLQSLLHPRGLVYWQSPIWIAYPEGSSIRHPAQGVFAWVSVLVCLCVSQTVINGH